VCAISSLTSTFVISSFDEFLLIKDRLRKKNMAMTHYETNHDYRKEPEVQIQHLNNKSNAEFLNQALTYRGYKQIENRQMQLLNPH